MKKDFKDYSHEELLRMTNEEISILFNIEEEKENQGRLHFEKNEYPKFSFDEKVKFWSGALHQQMRWQVESGLDPYSIYDLNWYKLVKEREPNIDSIIDTVFEKYWSSTGAEWSKEEYLKRLSASVRLSVSE